MLVTLDLDGTVLDSMTTLERLAVAQLTKIYGVGENTARQKYQATVGVPFRQQLEILFPDDLRNTRAARSFECTKTRVYRDCQFFSDVAGALASLYHLGVETALVSSTRATLVRDLVGSSHLQLTWVHGFRPGFSKWRRLMELQVTHDGPVIFAGDTPRDYMLCPSGIVFVGVNRGAPWSRFPDTVPVVTTLYDVLDAALSVLRQ